MITSRFKRYQKHKTAQHYLVYWFSLMLMSFSVDSFGQVLRFVGEETVPLLYENAQKSKEGALVDLAIALSIFTGHESTFEILPWARAYEIALQKPNVILISVLKTPQRKKKLQWIGKVLQAEAHLIALKERTGINIKHIDQTNNYVLSTVRGYAAAKYLLRQGFSEKYNLVLTSHQSQIWRLLYNRRVDLVLANLKLGRFEAKYIGLDPSLMESKLQILELKNELQFATGLSTPLKTVLSLQNGLKALKENGSYQTILKKWDLL